MLIYNKNIDEVIENEYQIQNEPLHASLLTTGNGYFGVRGSFEEFGSVNVQGTFIRGLFDEIIEIPKIYVDNIYMRNYYIDELKAKKFQYQDSAINFVDFLLIQVQIGNKIFLPWEGKIVNWIRYIDTNTGALIRKVLWDDGDGNLTELKYERFASFENNHQYLLKCEVTKINHDLESKILSGIDTLTKTNGQLKSNLISQNKINNYYNYIFHMGKLYNMTLNLNVYNEFHGCNTNTLEYVSDENGRHYEIINASSKTFGVSKLIFAVGSMDEIKDIDTFAKEGINNMIKKGYDNLYQEHLKVYNENWNDLKITLSDKEDNAYLAHANYQTLISADRYSKVHSLSAKNLTGEKYNQFIWWDAEIFQYPFFLMTNLDAAKNTLLYRYDRLKQSIENAKKLNLDGAKYAFCSSVLGDEKVWSYARHPFMQIHINSDIAYAIIRYVDLTDDFDFLKDYGMEMLLEISKYWISRVTYNNDKKRYEILKVTGTDEHHPYIDNNAYTNYLTQYILSRTYDWIKDFKFETENDFLNQIKDIKDNLYLPLLENGMIPQFDGYFELNPNLEVVGFGAARGFQMKESGLYHESQIIKQPDVIMLYTYVDILKDKSNYNENWLYYESKCESSSSLTYPVHAVAAIDNKETDKFYKYFNNAIKIDHIDLHNEAHLGLHAAAIAGGWYSIFRGLFGFEARKDYLEVNPKVFPKWENVIINFKYKNNKVKATLTNDKLLIESNHNFNLLYKNNIMKHDSLTTINL